ncbi:MAG: hypothetical protein WA973_04130 [Mesorhizobium sp.]
MAKLAEFEWAIGNSGFCRSEAGVPAVGLRLGHPVRKPILIDARTIGRAFIQVYLILLYVPLRKIDDLTS